MANKLNERGPLIAPIHPQTVAYTLTNRTTNYGELFEKVFFLQSKKAYISLYLPVAGF